MTSRPVDANTRPLPLSKLLDGIAAGLVVLPDFQRDFDWNDAEVISLVATLLKGWPAGSLLLMRGEPEFFRTREFEFAPKRTPRDLDYVVLDGQQRLTALYLALRGAGAEMFALDYTELEVEPSLGAEEIEDRIKRIDMSEWIREYDVRRQRTEKLVPLTALSSAPDFFEWRDDLVRDLDSSERDKLADRLSQIYRNLLGNLNHYEFPCVILDNDLPSAAVARIFERINRSGRRLNTFDLMVARAYEPKWNLRDQWDAATRDYESLDLFLADDGLPVLQTIALADRQDVRQPAVLDLSPARVHEAWDRAVASMDAAISLVRTFGAVGPEQLPYKAQLLTLAGLAWDRDLNQHAVKLERWFWATSLSGAYDVGSSTRVVSDVRELRRWLDGGDEPERPAVSFDTLVSATRRRFPPLWRTFISLLTRAEAVDLLDPTNDDSKVVAVSLFQPEPGGVHLRIFGVVKATRSTARQAKRESILGLLLAEPPTQLALDGQLLPADLRRYAGDSRGLLERRVELALDFLKVTLGDRVVELQRSVDP